MPFTLSIPPDRWLEHSPGYQRLAAPVVCLGGEGEVARTSIFPQKHICLTTRKIATLLTYLASIKFIFK